MTRFGLGFGVNMRIAVKAIVPPEEPSNILTEVLSESEVDIVYDDPPVACDGLRVYLSTDGVNYSFNRNIPYGQGSARLTGLTHTTNYTIKLVSYNSTLESTGITTTAATINNDLVDGWSFNPDSVSWFNHGVSGVSFNVGFKTAKYYNGKTYVVYSGFVMGAYIICYDHSTSTWSNPVLIGASPLPLDYTHGEPSLLVDASGYIHVWWGAHNSACKYSKSTNPEDISAWTAMTDFATGSYHHALQFSTGRIYVFYRSVGAPDCYWSYMTSDNGGTTWSAATVLSHDFAYGQFKKGVGDTIHAAFVGINTTALSRQHVYYLFFDGTNWKDVTGSNLTLPVDYATNAAQLVARSTGSNWVPLAMPNFDSSNNPYISYSESTTEEEFTTYNHKIARYSGGSWSNINIGASSRSWRNFITDIDIIGSGVIEAYLIAGTTDGVTGGNVERWRSVNSGVNWTKLQVVREGLFNYPVLVESYDADLRVLFVSYTVELTRFTEGIYAWGDSGFAKGLSTSSLDVVSKRLTNRMNISGGSFVDGVANKLLSLSGNPRYAVIADQDELSFTGGSPDLPFSFAFILKVTNPATTNQWILWKGQNTTKMEYRARVSANKLEFYVSGVLSTSAYIGRTAPYTSTSEVHVIITYDGSGLVGGIKIYLNNVQADNANATSGTYTGMTADTAGVYLGANQPLSQFLNGAIGELKIFNEELLEAERTLVMNGDPLW